jgi:hypothetical protein
MDIRYQEARGTMRTAVYARFRQQAALPNETIGQADEIRKLAGTHV